METISPVVFLNFFSWRKKYQKRDLATIWSGEKILILYRGGLGSLSEGSLRPMTSYSFNCKKQEIYIKPLNNYQNIFQLCRKNNKHVCDGISFT